MDTRLAVLVLTFHGAMTEFRTLKLEEFPFVVYINASDTSCSGSIITPDWVLTAATCLQDPQVSAYTVIAGIVHLPDMEHSKQIRGVQSIQLHPSFQSVQIPILYNLALLRVKSSFQMNTFVDSIGLTAVKPPYTHEKCRGVWFEDDGGTRASLSADMDHYKPHPDSCATFSPSPWKFVQLMCGNKQTEQSASPATVGKPLVCGDVQTGVYSFEHKFYQHVELEVFSEVSYFREWIRSVAPEAQFFRPLQRGGWETETNVKCGNPRKS